MDTNSRRGEGGGDGGSGSSNNDDCGLQSHIKDNHSFM